MYEWYETRVDDEELHAVFRHQNTLFKNVTVELREDVPLPPLAFDPFAWDNVLAMADRFEFATFRRRAEALMREEEEE